MLGFVVVTHLGIGKEMLRTVEEILKEKLPMIAISVNAQHPLSEYSHQIRGAIEQFQDNEGVIILTDLFGATPTNLCKEFCINERVRIITGCNLPIILKAATSRFHENINEVVDFLQNYGRNNIRTYPSSETQKC